MYRISRLFRPARGLSTTRDAILQALRTVKHPDTKLDIVRGGIVTDVALSGGDAATVTMTPDKHYRQLKAEAMRAVSSLPGVSRASVLMEAVKPGQKGPLSAQANARPAGLSKVRSIIAVHSCKGGVGKSTVAVNLSYSLAQLSCPDAPDRRLRIGIFDADIYGPSLPSLISPASTELRAASPDSKLIEPLTYQGVKAMSYGWARAVSRRGPDGRVERKEAGAAVMRGPLVSNVVSQLVTQTQWGDLDCLILDMPPGTGDIVITLCQQLQITSAVLVTTPQKLSFVDVIKGVNLFEKVNVPIVGVVENMAYFDCGSCTTRHRPFAATAEPDKFRKRLVSTFGLAKTSVFELPIFQPFTESSEAGHPLVLDGSGETASVRATYASLASTVLEQTQQLLAQPSQPPGVSYNPARPHELIVTMYDSDSPSDPGTGTGTAAASTGFSRTRTYVWSPAELRRKCHCAACVDERTGEALLNPDSVPETIRPVHMQRRGNYALALHWSDGHTSSVYPWTMLCDESKRRPDTGQA